MATKLHLLRGQNRVLIPVPLIDKALGRIAGTAKGEALEKLNKIALVWIRRTIWEELAKRNDCEYDKQVIPLTLKEFNWMKEKYDQPI